MDSQPAAGWTARTVGAWKNDYVLPDRTRAGHSPAAMGRRPGGRCGPARQPRPGPYGTILVGRLVLARNAEVLLADGQVSALRRIVTETPKSVTSNVAASSFRRRSPCDPAPAASPARPSAKCRHRQRPRRRTFASCDRRSGSRFRPLEISTPAPANAFWYGAGLGAICRWPGAVWC